MYASMIGPDMTLKPKLKLKPQQPNDKSSFSILFRAQIPYSSFSRQDVAEEPQAAPVIHHESNNLQQQHLLQSKAGRQQQQ